MPNAAARLLSRALAAAGSGALSAGAPLLNLTIPKSGYR